MSSYRTKGEGWVSTNVVRTVTEAFFDGPRSLESGKEEGVLRWIGGDPGTEVEIT